MPEIIARKRFHKLWLNFLLKIMTTARAIIRSAPSYIERLSTLWTFIEDNRLYQPIHHASKSNATNYGSE